MLQAKSTQPTTPPPNLFIARQAILDRNSEVFGYELLFRDGHYTASGVVENGNYATAKVISNVFIDIGIDKITDNKHFFINLTRDYITGDIPLPVYDQKIVLEVLEDVEADSKTLAGLQKLKNDGFCIALDDFVLAKNNVDFIVLADIIKIDVLDVDKEILESQINQLREYPVKLLAEKVETLDDFEFCKSLGFHYFQGYYFCKPNIISQQEIPANNLTVINIIAALQSTDCDIDTIEEIISKDVGISFKLLKIMNSAYYGLGKKVKSIQHALVLLGMSKLKIWVTVISLSMLEHKPMELIRLSLVRAKMAELLSKDYSCSADEAFTVGLFSLLDALLETPLESLVAELPLSSATLDGLLNNKGPLGRLLVSICYYEKGEWEELIQAGDNFENFKSAYWEAITWSDQITYGL